MSANFEGVQHGSGELTAMAGLKKFGSVAAFRAAAPLPKNTQEVIDKAVIEVGRSRLQFVNLLLSRGLIYSLPNWLSVPTLYWEKLGDSGTARETMVPKARGERQVRDREGTTIPIYCTWDNFSFNARELAMGERVGVPLDTSHISMATRNVNERIEDTAINGGPTIGGFDTPGLLNAPNVNREQFIGDAAGREWTNSGKTGAGILRDVRLGANALRGDHKYGPYTLLVNGDDNAALDDDFKANSDKTIRQRLRELEFGGSPLDIQVVDSMPANTVVMAQMTDDVMRMVVGQSPSVISWEDGPGWEREFVVLACLVPQFRDDYNGQSGIVILNTTGTA